MENIFETLYNINVNDKTEKKNDLTYLSWAWAWGVFKSYYPEATYTIKRNEQGLPYIYDENLGYMVFTEVRIGELTHEMWLPVMDSANKAMKDKPYTYKIKEYKYGKATGNMIEKTCESATMFDINKTIMRCLTKNLAMFGLGLYIYAGEDLPEDLSQDNKPEDDTKNKYEVKISKSELTILQAMIKTLPNAKEFYDHILEHYKIKDLSELTKIQDGEILQEIKKYKED